MAIMPYVIVLSRESREHLRALTARQRATVLNAIEAHLLHQPGVQTRNRKPMIENPLGPWVLRVGEMRVYYELEDEPQPTVTILAIGRKDRNFLLAGDQVFDLTRNVDDEDDRY
jgi:mRNA-degrading endonuclease RelE of RelBE toxin-antitoxin system